MVAFRKLFPVLAIVALLLGTALTASAQGVGTPLRCTANAGVPPIVRAEGYTELTGDLVVECSGGNPAQPFIANFQLFLNTNITSKLLSSSMTEALLLVDEPGIPRVLADGTTAGTPTPFCVEGLVSAPVCNPGVAGATYQQGTFTVYRGVRGSQPGSANENLVVWPGVPVTPPGSNQSRVFRFTNVRANASGLGASQTLIPTQIVAYISVFPQGTLPIDNPQQTVGYVQQGMVFDVRTCTNGGPSLPFGYNQCQNLNRDWYNDPSRSSAIPGIGQLRFREGFQTAFKVRIEPGQESSLPGQVFNSESGFVRPEITDGTGLATAGTRLAARFVNIPANVRLFVSTVNVGYTSTSVPGAVLVSADAIGGGSTVGIDGPTAISDCPTADPVRNWDAIEIPLTSGAGVAVWEVTAANPSAIDEIRFAFSAAYASNVQAGQPALGTGTVIGNLAPFYAAGGAAERMSSSLPIPRFVSRTDAVNLIRINQCVTNLLFPYVTNWSNFDTGIAIANTSQDPFGSPNDRLNSGTCRINYYGKLANGDPPTVTNETTDREVLAGETLTFILSGGGTYGLKGNPNFQGYIIAQCGFLFGHGFAFITDGPIGQARVAEGYLALVLDGADAGRMRGTTFGEVRGH